MRRKVKMSERGLVRDSRGVTSVEFALVMSVFFLFIFGIIDFSKAFWEMNSAAKATQIGVRFAVVNDPVSDAVIFDGAAAGVANGDPVPIALFNGGNPVMREPPTPPRSWPSSPGCNRSTTTSNRRTSSSHTSISDWGSRAARSARRSIPW